jgi:outer membrane usher protein FimD/PapC
MAWSTASDDRGGGVGFTVSFGSGSTDVSLSRKNNEATSNECLLIWKHGIWEITDIY